VKVLIPSPLLAYTGQSHVDARGATLAEVLEDLDRQFPGLRFRVVDEQDRFRPHVRFFLHNEPVFDLSMPVGENDEIVIVQALSGG
jgi:sulfur-carrier protein